MTETAPLALRSAVDAAAATLRAAGIVEPRRDALRILAALRDETPGAVIAAGVESLTPDESAALATAVGRRARGEPLAYVVGRAGFRHLDLAVDRRTLIPRPETEGLVDRAIDRVRAGASGTIADIGTGSGCIAVSLATELRVDVLATDVSPGAIAVARRNAVSSGASVSFLRTDLAGALGDSSLGVLVSNPPYLSSAEYASIERSVRDWEPRLALESGSDGMAATLRLLDEGLRVVRAGGWIALEVDCSRAAVAARRAQELGWRDVTIDNDPFGRERYLLARRSDS